MDRAGHRGLAPSRSRRETIAMMFFTGGTTGFPKAQSIGTDTSWHSAGSRRRSSPPRIRQRDLVVGRADVPYLRPSSRRDSSDLYRLDPRDGATVQTGYRPQPTVTLQRNAVRRRTIDRDVGRLDPREGMKPADLSSLKICSAGGSACSEDLLDNWAKTTGCASRRHRHVGRRALREQSGCRKAQGAFGRSAAAGNRCRDRGPRDRDSRFARVRTR